MEAVWCADFGAGSAALGTDGAKNSPEPYGKWLEGFDSPLGTQQSADRTSDEGVI
ncbi:MAG: hypothetical protein HDQ97_18420 [Lachnospiraceae bacterium]|nr:hypothetical protein [Lachnospiraceae bacterium]